MSKREPLPEDKDSNALSMLASTAHEQQQQSPGRSRTTTTTRQQRSKQQQQQFTTTTVPHTLTIPVSGGIGGEVLELTDIQQQHLTTSTPFVVDTSRLGNLAMNGQQALFIPLSNDANTSLNASSGGVGGIQVLNAGQMTVSASGTTTQPLQQQSIMSQSGGPGQQLVTVQLPVVDQQSGQTTMQTLQLQVPSVPQSGATAAPQLVQLSSPTGPQTVQIVETKSTAPTSSTQQQQLQLPVMSQAMPIVLTTPTKHQGGAGGQMQTQTQFFVPLQTSAVQPLMVVSSPTSTTASTSTNQVQYVTLQQPQQTPQQMFLIGSPTTTPTSDPSSLVVSQAPTSQPAPSTISMLPSGQCVLLQAQSPTNAATVYNVQQTTGQQQQTLIPVQMTSPTATTRRTTRSNSNRTSKATPQTSTVESLRLVEKSSAAGSSTDDFSNSKLIKVGDMYMRQDPNDATKWHLIPSGSDAEAASSGGGTIESTADTSMSQQVVTGNGPPPGQILFRVAGTGAGPRTVAVLSKSSLNAFGGTVHGGTPTDPGPYKKRQACNCPNCDANRTRKPEDRFKNHICHIAGCNRTYGKTSHLRAHLRGHIGQKPFVCDYLSCTKAFTRSDELQRHLRTHTGEKKYVCTVCEKGFLRSDHLRKHELTHNSPSGSRRQQQQIGQHQQNIIVITPDDIETQADPDYIDASI